MTPLYAFIDLNFLIFPVEDEDLPLHDEKTRRMCLTISNVKKYVGRFIHSHRNHWWFPTGNGRCVRFHFKSIEINIHLWMISKKMIVWNSAIIKLLFLPGQNHTYFIQIYQNPIQTTRSPPSVENLPFVSQGQRQQFPPWTAGLDLGEGGVYPPMMAIKW